ncbi:DUF418 domain-containing protein [Erythrobacter crassostreae]|uniref:DUF418 domain-containing protein n=1 Tax=Erythrobacter crassostreae TaxID=2828328 RepID=A0A9X1F2W9_9SPHN|nr:DUF418 domain-containing protein [Erythrobacter crassostrea]MBV7259169.1 DUF418 domain-containing protein [Erythrobacter crassostrea]
MSDASATPAADDITADSEAVLAPVTVKERISSLDFIRGIAVMGILAANIIAFGQPLMATFDPGSFLSNDNDPDHWWWIAQFVLIDGKMRGLFSILFGAGLFLFLEKANERGSGTGLVIRRLAFLGMFGLLHFYFIWFGDILFLYAVSALVLLAFYTLKPFNQFVLGMLGFVISALIYTAMMGGLYLMANGNLLSPEEAAEMQREMASGMSVAQGMTDAILAGDYLGFVASNFTENLLTPISAVSQSLVETSSLMLIGMGLFRMGFFEGKFDRKKMVLWGWSGIIVGGALSYWVATWVISTDFDLLAAMAAYLGTSALPRLAMAMGLAALLVVYSPSWTGWLGQRISAAGRAAFTNYLGTSIVMLFVFHGWALGYYGDLGRPQLYIIVVIMWAVMLIWSKPWLDRYRYGPLEWLWRCLTYWKKFPLRR